MLIPRKILVPLDFSESSAELLEDALDLASQFKAKVYLLHVIETKLIQCIDDYCLNQELVQQLAGDRAAQITDDYPISGLLVQKMEEDMARSAREKLQAMLEAIPANRNLETVIKVRTGAPAAEITREQQEQGIDLIIMASRGRAGLQEYLGSTAEKVVRGATGSVMVVKS